MSSTGQIILYFLNCSNWWQWSRNWKCWFLNSKFHCFSGFLWVSGHPVCQHWTLQLLMRAFNSTLPGNVRRGCLREVNIGREAPYKTNRIFLLSVVMGYTQPSWCDKPASASSYYTVIIPAERSWQLIAEDMIITLLDVGQTCFGLMPIKHLTVFLCCHMLIEA